MRFSYHGVKFHGRSRNHNFKVYNKKLYPNFKLFEGWDEVEQLIPPNARSLIDLACCRGFYVLQSIMQGNIDRAVGIDIDEDSLKAANQARSLTRVKSAAFHRGTLENILTDSTIGKTEFDVVLLTDAYHHFFWGGNHNRAYRNHDDILSRLAQLCGDTLIISACFDVQQLPPALRDQAMTSPDAKRYTLCHFLEAAENWFYVTQNGMLGEYPLYTLKKKHLKNTAQATPVEVLELNDAIKYMHG